MQLVVVLKLHKRLLLAFKLDTWCLFCCCTPNPPTDGDLKVESALRTQAPSVSLPAFLDSASRSAWSSVAHVSVWFPEWVCGRLIKHSGIPFSGWNSPLLPGKRRTGQGDGLLLARTRRWVFPCPSRTSPWVYTAVCKQRDRDLSNLNGNLV